MSVLEYALGHRRDKPCDFFPSRGRRRCTSDPSVHTGRQARPTGCARLHWDQVRDWFSHEGVTSASSSGKYQTVSVVVIWTTASSRPSGFAYRLRRCEDRALKSRGFHLSTERRQATGIRRGRGARYAHRCRSTSWRRRASTRSVVCANSWQLPLAELELAAFSDVEIPMEGSARRTRKPKNTANNNIRPSKALLLRTDPQLNHQSWLKKYDKGQPRCSRRWHGLWGLTRPSGEFRCVLHPEKSASASLYQSKSGDWLYHELAWPSPRLRRMADPRPSTRSQGGKDRQARRPEQATWKLILLLEAGLLQPAQVPAARLWAETSDMTRHVYERFLFLSPRAGTTAMARPRRSPVSSPPLSVGSASVKRGKR